MKRCIPTARSTLFKDTCTSLLMRRFFLFTFVLCFLALGGTASAQTTATSSGAQMNGFSRALDVDGDHVFVGEPQNIHTPGRVYVYENDAQDEWSETTYLEATDGEVGDGFGSALNASGDMLLVGAPSSNAAYLYQSDGEEWTQTARLTSSDSTRGFGRSVVLDGNRLFVGTGSTVNIQESDTLTSGAVHVFEQQGDRWQESTVLRSEDVGENAGFASSLLASAPHLLVSAPQSDAGAVVVFRHGPDGWTEQQTITPGELGSSARFGSALAWVDGDVVVGAPRAYDATGVAYHVSFDANEELTIEGRLLPYEGGSRHLFGAAFAYDGSRLWVGAPGASERAGTLYRFTRDGTNWSGVRQVTHPKVDSGNLLGGTLAGNESILAVGLPGDDHRAGTMGIYSIADGKWTQTDPVAPSTGTVLSAMTGEEMKCSDGSVAQFSCEKVDMKSFLPIGDIGGERGIELNDIWGWTDPETGTEYALVGRTDGSAFVDVSDPRNPVFVGELPLTEGARVNSWRDIKVYKNHAFVVADNAGDHGMQVFDLTRLREVDPTEMPVTFEPDALYDQVNSVHNIVINTESGYAYAVGSSGGGKTCGGGLHMINIEDPLNPTFEGCFQDPSTGRSGTGYSHDAQCVMYNGPDTEYQGREICIGLNETAISVADVTDKENPKAVSTASYPDHGYVHQGWFTEDQRYFYQNDELDEAQGKVEHTRTLVWDLTDLDNPQLVNQKLLPEKSIDHNLYVKGSTMYQSNYKSGLRILDISDPENPEEVAHFDTQPYDDNGTGFQGTWSNYPYFDSGIIVVSSIGEGLFVLEESKQEL